MSAPTPRRSSQAITPRAHDGAELGTGRRAVIYARYSDDLQRPESIADQIEVCRRYAAQQGWHVIATYDDPRSAAAAGSGRAPSGCWRMPRRGGSISCCARALSG